MTATITTDALAGITVGQVEPGDVIVIDAIFGMERVLAVDTLYLSTNPVVPSSIASSPWDARRLELRDRYGTPRFAIRFPHEPCVRVTAEMSLAGEAD